MAAPPATRLKLLHVAAEVFPLIKTGGLADVVAALPVALAAQGEDVRLLLPGFPAVLGGVQKLRKVLDIGPCFGALHVRLMLGRMPATNLPAYVVDAPFLYRRGGGPYHDESGAEWPDNALRFALLGWVAAHLAGGDADTRWAPQVVHAHDWHAALACAYMRQHPSGQTASVFTVHNLAYQGLFPIADGALLGLGAAFMSPSALEFHGQMSFMKAGLKFANRVTTVSPSYAREIATAQYGCGLEGVIRQRGAAVSGILNGIDCMQWNPARDPAIAAHYDPGRLAGKLACRRALQDEMGLEPDEQSLLLGVVSRLTEQKGLDLLLAALPELVEAGVQVVVQGTGEPALVAAFRAARDAWPQRVQVRIGYDEDRAHRIVAGADCIAVPSRFEPCGLTQLYGLRYGTLPLVRRVGGLADTVIDDQGPDDPQSTGFAFDAATDTALAQCVLRAQAVHRDTARWQRLMQRGMAIDLSWAAPARSYTGLYRELLARP